MTKQYYELRIEDRERTILALEKAGYRIRKQGQLGDGIFNYKVFDPRRVKTDKDGLIQDESYVGKLNTDGAEIIAKTGIERILAKLKLPLKQIPLNVPDKN